MIIKTKKDWNWFLSDTKLEQFILDFQDKAMETSSVHPFTNKIISHGWHSETIARKCEKNFGKQAYQQAKDFIFNQAKKGKDNE